MFTNHILIIVTGIPCAGKSYLTTLLQSKYKDKYTFLKIERDEIFGKIVETYSNIGSNKKNRLITEEMNKIYIEFNSSINDVILVVDSCSGSDGIRQFIMDKASSKTKTIVVNIHPKVISNSLDIDFYIKRAKAREQHYVFPRELEAQIKELRKCYDQYRPAQKSHNYDVVDLNFDWNSEDISIEI